jgi:predicted secreted protein
LLRTFEKDDPSTTLVWDLKNEAGSSVASGVYIYLIRDGKNEARGKVALIR